MREIEKFDLPKFKRRPDYITNEKDTSQNNNWNYSPLIEKIFPEGYIKSDLWSLANPAKLDIKFHKGFPFNLDDCVPNFDFGIKKTQDILLTFLFIKV